MLLGHNDGTFAAPITILSAGREFPPPPVGFEVNSLLIGNFNHDSKPDVAVVASSTVHAPDKTFGIATVLNTSGPASAPATKLAPSSLTFAPQATGTTSSPQTVQVTNTGGAPLTVSGISITGGNAGDFSQTNTCSSPLAGGASCQISVTFNPSGMGTRTASLSVSDNATASPQMVALSGSGPDFSLSAETSSATVMPGQTATYIISAAPSAGFNQTVTLTCSGAPALTTCSISPSSLQLNGTSSSTAMVTITTTAPSMGRVPPLGRNDRFIDPGLRPFLVCLVSVILTLMLLARRPKPQLRWAAPFAFVALLLLAATLSSCGGGSSSSGTGGTNSPGTAAGTYTITVTGTGSSATTHTTTLKLVVQ